MLTGPPLRPRYWHRPTDDKLMRCPYCLLKRRHTPTDVIVERDQPMVVVYQCSICKRRHRREWR